MPLPTARQGFFFSFFFFFSKSCQDLFILWIRPDPIHPGQHAGGAVVLRQPRRLESPPPARRPAGRRHAGLLGRPGADRGPNGGRAATRGPAARPPTVRDSPGRRRGLPATACCVPGGKFVPSRAGGAGRAGAVRLTPCAPLPRGRRPSVCGARGRRAPARCALRPARSGCSPDAPPPLPPRGRRLHFLFL